MPSKSGHVVIPPPLHPPIPRMSFQPRVHLSPTPNCNDPYWHVCHHLTPTLQESWHRLEMKHGSSSKLLLWHSSTENYLLLLCVSVFIITHAHSFLCVTIKQWQNESLLLPHYHSCFKPQTRARPNFTGSKIHYHFSTDYNILLQFSACILKFKCYWRMHRNYEKETASTPAATDLSWSTASRMKNSKSKCSWVLRSKHRYLTEICDFVYSSTYERFG